MKVIILCGGIGTRLKEETEFKPKPMVFIGDKPLIWHIMKIYAHYGYREFIFALGYKGDYIKNYFLNQKALSSDFVLHTKTHETTFFLEQRKKVDDFHITFVNTGLDTLPGERILLCEEYIPKTDTEFMITYGDGVTDLNIRTLVDFHHKQKTMGTITGVHPRTKYGMVHVNKKNLVSSFQEKPVLTDWVNGGFMIFHRTFFQYLRKGETEHPALIRLAKEKQLSMYQHNGFWYAIDTFKELSDLQNIWKSGKSPWKVWL